MWRQLERFARNHPTPLYLGSIAGLSLGLMLLALVFAAVVGVSKAALLLVFLLSLVPALTITVDLVNWAVTQIFKPEGLAPCMDFSRGLPEECTTLVVIPALLSGPDEVDLLVGQLEQHFLRNLDPGLFFALLTDFVDFLTETQPGDADLVELARLGICSLNEKYPRGAGSGRYTEVRFALLHRERRGIRPKTSGWAGSASAASSTSWTACSWLGGQIPGHSLRDPMPSSQSGRGTDSFWSTSATSSPWMRTHPAREAARELIAVLAYPRTVPASNLQVRVDAVSKSFRDIPFFSRAPISIRSAAVFQSLPGSSPEIPAWIFTHGLRRMSTRTCSEKVAMSAREPTRSTASNAACKAASPKTPCSATTC